MFPRGSSACWSAVIPALQKRGYPVVRQAERVPADLRRRRARVVTKIAAASQRPTALSTLSDPAGPPAWKTIPSWYLVAGADKVIGLILDAAAGRR